MSKELQIAIDVIFHEVPKEIEDTFYAKVEAMVDVEDEGTIVHIAGLIRDIFAQTLQYVIDTQKANIQYINKRD